MALLIDHNKFYQSINSTTWQRKCISFAARLQSSAKTASMALAVVLCPSVRLCCPITYMQCVEASKHKLILNFLKPSFRRTILVFPYQTLWQHFDGVCLTGATSSSAIAKRLRECFVSVSSCRLRCVKTSSVVFFTARCICISAVPVYAVTRCPSVRPCVRHVRELRQNE